MSQQVLLDAECQKQSQTKAYGGENMKDKSQVQFKEFPSGLRRPHPGKNTFCPKG